MTATARVSGHDSRWAGDRWVYADDGQPVTDSPPRACASCGRATQPLRVPIAADLSHTGKARVATKPIDACLFDLVRALNVMGIPTRSSCCGHGKGPGEILLQDGRTLRVEWGAAE